MIIYNTFIRKLIALRIVYKELISELTDQVETSDNPEFTRGQISGLEIAINRINLLIDRTQKSLGV